MMDVRVSTRGSNIADRTFLADLITPSLINYRNSTDRFSPEFFRRGYTLLLIPVSPVIQLGPGPSTKVHNPRRLRNSSSFPRQPAFAASAPTKNDEGRQNSFAYTVHSRDLPSVVFNDGKRCRILNRSTGITPPNLARHRHDVSEKTKRRNSEEERGR